MKSTKSHFSIRYFKFSSVSKFISDLETKNVATELWASGKDKAQKWAKLYGDIDTLRPYFDVEPRTIANRVFQSFIPVTDLGTPEKGLFEKASF